MSESLTLILPIPHPVLWPNGRTKRHGYRAMLVNKARKLARDQVTAANIETAPWGRARLAATFTFNTIRTRDTDNATAALKAYVDGITEALLVDDNSEVLRRDEPEIVVDKSVKTQFVTLTLTRLTSGAKKAKNAKGNRPKRAATNNPNRSGKNATA